MSDPFAIEGPAVISFSGGPRVDRQPKSAHGDLPRETAIGDAPTLRRLTCKRCGCGIDCGLCGWECPLDNTQASERDPADMEVRIYTLSGIEPVEKPEPKEPDVVPLDDPSVPESLVPMPGIGDTSTDPAKKERSRVMRKGFVWGRGECVCGKVVCLDLRDGLRAHACTHSSGGYHQGGGEPVRILSRGHDGPDTAEALFRALQQQRDVIQAWADRAVHALDAARRTLSVDHPVRQHIEAVLKDQPAGLEPVSASQVPIPGRPQEPT